MNGTSEPGACQVCSKTGIPCPRRAAVEIRGVPFCAECARGQEAYFAIGELTQGKQGRRGKALAQALKRTRRERASTREGIAVETRHGPSGAHETEPLALRTGARARDQDADSTVKNRTPAHGTSIRGS